MRLTCHRGFSPLRDCAGRFPARSPAAPLKVAPDDRSCPVLMMDKLGAEWAFPSPNQTDSSIFAVGTLAAKSSSDIVGQRTANLAAEINSTIK